MRTARTCSEPRRGTYRIEVVAPGYTFVVADQGVDDLVDSDVEPTDGRTAFFDVVSDSTDRSLDAGIEPATIGDFVFEDANGNGLQDPGESGIEGVTVRLLDNDGNVLETDVTSAAGAYSFIVAPDQYQIEVVTPSGYTPTTADAGADDALDSDVDPTSGRTAVATVVDSDDHDDIDAGYFRTTSIGDFVWLDQDRYGIQDTASLAWPACWSRSPMALVRRSPRRPPTRTAPTRSPASRQVSTP